MAHFAKLTDTNEVLGVEVVADANTTNDSNVEDEATGVAFLTNIHGWSLWKKCSYNTRIGKHWQADGTESSDQSKALRKNYPAVGWKYDPSADGFYDPNSKPYDSWTLDPTTFEYEAPVTYPTITTYNSGADSYIIRWDETNLRWTATDTEDPVGSFNWDATNKNWVSV
tara:strand:+ start:37 stop:543 length:507 start_codon:yes stop_codon:yes gene_type:complete